MWKKIAAGFYIWNLFLAIFAGTYHLILAGMWLFLYLLLEARDRPTPPRPDETVGPESERIP